MNEILKEAYVKAYGNEPEIREINKSNLEDLERAKEFLTDGFIYYIFMPDNNIVYEFEESENEDVIEYMKENWGIPCHIEAFVNEFTEYEIGGNKYRIIFDTIYFDNLDFIMINDEISYMNEMFKEIYDDYGMIYISGSNLDWRGSNGYKIIREMSNIFSSLLPDYDARVVIYQNINDPKDIFAKIYSHDVPMGSTLELIPLIDIRDIMGDMGYDYEQGQHKGSSHKEFLRDFYKRTNIKVNDTDIKFDAEGDCYRIFDGEIDIFVKDDLTTVEFITYDEEYLERRLINTL